MNILNELENHINHLNNIFNFKFSIDTIRAKFSKKYTLERLQAIGKWQKLQKNSEIFKRVQKKEYPTKITSVHRLKNYDVYYYNYQDKFSRLAKLVMYGLHQYEDDMSIIPIDRLLIKRLLETVGNSVLSKKDNVDIDVCYDMPSKPNIANLKPHFTLTPFWGSIYINEPHIMAVERVNIYNKTQKDDLQETLYRVEATVQVHNLKDIFIPLDDVYDHIVKPLYIHSG
jgi:hypothetical protein